MTPRTDPFRFVTLPDVVLAEVGTWPAMSGEFVCTADDLKDAVEASQDPGFWAPRGKIGDTVHSAQGKAVGRYENLRLSTRIDEEGREVLQLRGDHACIPAEFLATMPSDYPSRSIEGKRDVTSPVTGKPYRLALTAVELLGVDGPAVRTLPDITPEQVAAVLDVAASASIEGGVITTPVLAAAIEVSDEDVRRAWYAAHPSKNDEMGSWVYEFYAEPRVVIIDAGDDGFQRVTWDIDAKGEVTFGKPEKVDREWVAASAPTVTAASPVRVFDTRAESLVTDSTMEDHMDPKAIREALGLPEDATDEQVLEAAKAAAALSKDDGDDADDSKGGDDDADKDADAAKAAEEEEADKVAAAAAADDGTIKLSAGQWSAVEQKLEAFDKLTARLNADEDERVLASAVGKRITASEKPDMEKRLQNPATRESTLVLLTADVKDGGLPVIKSLGGPTVQLSDGGAEASEGFNDLVARQRAAMNINTGGKPA